MNVTSFNTIQKNYTFTRNNSDIINNSTLEKYFELFASSGTSVSSESSDKSLLVPENGMLYKELGDRAVASAEEIAQQRKMFADMYVPATTARKYYDPSLVGLPDENISFEECGSKKAYDLETAAWQSAKRAGCIIVPLGAGELPEFMDYVLDSLKNGMSFEQTLQNHLDKQPLLNGELLVQGNNDWFMVNPSNGDVMGAFKGGRVQTGSVASDEVIDRKAVYELADDLNTFLRYAAFPQENDEPEKISELFSYIKNKQAYANFDRFLADGEDSVADAILQTLIAAGVLKGDVEEEEKDEAIDGLMEAIRIHQEELREEAIDQEGTKNAIAEIQEIIDSLVKV